MASRAWVWHGGAQWTLEDVPMPEPAYGEVLVKVGGVAFCGSEKVWERVPVEALPPAQLNSLPCIGGRGHEVAGTVANLGSGVSGHKPGDRIAILHVLGCKKCRFCTSGFENRCPFRTEGSGLRGYRDYIVIPAALAYSIPDEIPMEEAPFIEPAAIGVHVTEKMARVRPGETVLIFGVGQIGSFCAQVAKISGARVIVVDPQPLARHSANDLSFDVVIDPGRQDVAAIVGKETNGLGADVIMECSGDLSNYQQCLSLLAPGARAVVVGTSDQMVVTINLRMLTSKEASLITSSACVGEDYARTLDLVRWGKLKLNWLGGKAITKYRMEEFPEARTEWMDLKNMLYVIMP